MSSKVDLVIPVYLNQRIVFDLVAMLQDGISTVVKIQETQESNQKNEKEIEASFGLSQVISSLFRIDIQGSHKSENLEGHETRLIQDKIHTPASLFQKVRTLLKENGDLISENIEDAITPGSMIEFKARLRRNPVIELMDVMVPFMELAKVIAAQEKKKAIPGIKTPKEGKPPQNEIDPIIEQMKYFQDAVKSGFTLDVVTDELMFGYKSVITLEKAFLSDPSMADLVDGEFTVLGKVTRVIADESGTINLMRKSSIAPMTKLLHPLLAQFTQAASPLNTIINQTEIEVKGPVIQVIPVAIFT